MSNAWLMPIMVDQGHCFNMCDWYGHLKEPQIPIWRAILMTWDNAIAATIRSQYACKFA